MGRAARQNVSRTLAVTRLRSLLRGLAGSQLDSSLTWLATGSGLGGRCKRQLLGLQYYPSNMLHVSDR